MVRRNDERSREVTSGEISSGFSDPSLQGHFSPGFDGTGL